MSKQEDVTREVQEGAVLLRALVAYYDRHYYLAPAEFLRGVLESVEEIENKIIAKMRLNSTHLDVVVPRISNLPPVGHEVGSSG